MTKDNLGLEVGSIVKVVCENSFLNGKLGTLLMSEDDDGIIFGTCVLIDGAVYGFSPEEVRNLDLDSENQLYSDANIFAK
mgnify:CR=1 FL=1